MSCSLQNWLRAEIAETAITDPLRYSDGSGDGSLSATRLAEYWANHANGSLKALGDPDHDIWSQAALAIDWWESQ